MDWANERYVRVYIRDTGDWLMWPWQTRALLVFIFRKVDRSGVLHLGKGKLRALSAVVGMPEEEVAIGLEPLIEDGCVQLSGDKLIVPNFMEAQETPQSDKLRKQASRERSREDAIASIGPRESRAVTPCHTESREVTLSQTEPSQTEPCRAASDTAAPSEVPRAPERRLKSVPPPAPFEPTDRSRIEDAIRAQPKLADLDIGDLSGFAATRIVTKGTKFEWVLQAIEDAAEKSQRGEQSHVRHSRVIGFIKHAKGPKRDEREVKGGPAYSEFKFDPGEVKAARRAVPARPKPAADVAPLTDEKRAELANALANFWRGPPSASTEQQLRDKASSDIRRLEEQEKKAGGT